MPKIAIIVEYTVPPQNRAAFDTELRNNCRQTLQDAGCERMEILLHESDPQRVTLSELWLDEESIRKHREQPGHDASHAAVDTLIGNKIVSRYRLSEE